MNDDEKEQLAVLKNMFNLAICADYQMCKCVSYWEMSAQPESAYYLQKLNHNVFGIVNHAFNSSTVNLFDEQVGPKKTDLDKACLSMKIAQMYNKSDVFTTQEPKQFISRYGTTKSCIYNTGAKTVHLTLW